MKSFCTVDQATGVELVKSPVFSGSSATRSSSWSVAGEPDGAEVTISIQVGAAGVLASPS